MNNHLQARVLCRYQLQIRLRRMHCRDVYICIIFTRMAIIIKSLKKRTGHALARFTHTLRLVRTAQWVARVQSTEQSRRCAAMHDLMGTFGVTMIIIYWHLFIVYLFICVLSFVRSFIIMTIYAHTGPAVVEQKTWNMKNEKLYARMRETIDRNIKSILLLLPPALYYLYGGRLLHVYWARASDPPYNIQLNINLRSKQVRIRNASTRRALI